MSWFSTISDALRHEPEVWGEYFLGQKFNERASGISAKPRYSGMLIRILAFYFKLIKSYKYRAKECIPSSFDVLAIALTSNQVASLSTTASKIKSHGFSILCVTRHGSPIITKEFDVDNCQCISLNLKDVLKVCLLFVLRAPKIWWELRSKDRRLRNWCFDKFLRCHIYLVYFEKLLGLSNPRLILMSNDHNAPQRCLLALAKVKGIQTAYMQHASVSRLFPALAFDYNLLDGVMALKNYIECDSNKRKHVQLEYSRHIFLSGQKKSIHRNRSVKMSDVGYAIKAVDDIQKVMEVVAAITRVGYAVHLRWHPATNFSKVNEIREVCAVLPFVKLSDPLIDSVGDFLSRIGILVAANSSIHLEAAVVGVMPIHYENNPKNTWDYYGYIKNGISIPAHDTSELVRLICEIESGCRKQNLSAIQAYSATFGTEWEGREGELAADIIKNLLNGVDPDKCWGYAGVMVSSDIKIVNKIILNT